MSPKNGNNPPGRLISATDARYEDTDMHPDALRIFEKIIHKFDLPLILKAYDMLLINDDIFDAENEEDETNEHPIFKAISLLREIQSFGVELTKLITGLKALRVLEETTTIIHDNLEEAIEKFLKGQKYIQFTSNGLSTAKQCLKTFLSPDYITELTHVIDHVQLIFDTKKDGAHCVEFKRDITLLGNDPNTLHRQAAIFLQELLLIFRILSEKGEITNVRLIKKTIMSSTDVN